MTYSLPVCYRYRIGFAVFFDNESNATAFLGKN